MVVCYRDIAFTNNERSLSKSLRNSEISIDESCRTFIDGVPGRREFYSPGWPSPYPNHTDCVLVLEAPRGYLLRLDFRDCFDMEPSDDCRFDFLEVRDGAHGYCQLLGQFCGKDFPPMITSTDRNLWLRFHSDDNIEYAGFKAIYEFIPRPTLSSISPEVDTCRIDVTGNEGIFSSADIPEERLRMVETYKIAIDCMWVIKVQEGWKIQLSFPEFKLEKPNDCDNNFVDVFSDRTDLPSRQRNFCGSIADSVISKSNIIFVRFFAEAGAFNSKFRAVYTAFREKKGGETCADDEWDCEDATCISIQLRCNGRINCRFRWDEDDCVSHKTVALNSEHIVIIMVVFSFILSGMCLTFIFHCLKKLIRDYRTIQDHLRQSYEQQLNMFDPKFNISISAANKKPLSHSNSTLSSGSQKFDSLRDVAPCYVPGSELLPILIQNHIGCNMMFPSTFGEGDVQPEMYDSACQTRDVGFSPKIIKSVVMCKSPAHFSTFGYHSREDRYRSEENMEIECYERYQPFEMQPAKSAPDVIATH